MYSLTLSKEERSAFDWVGNRYTNGDAMWNVLTDYLPEGVEWLDDGAITFELPLEAVQALKRLAQQENNLWPCFSNRLKYKMIAFVSLA